MSNTDDDNIQKISKMLEIGGTMLAQHCDNCGAPLFRYQGRVLCPVCDDVRDPRGAGQPTSATISRPSPKPEPSPVKEKESPVAAVAGQALPEKRSKAEFAASAAPLQGSVLDLESLMINKMLAIAREMQDESDARRVTEYLDVIDRCMEIVVKMRNSL
ncbi:Sjogren's syndrome/scleroderma autoantigen 1 family protein [Methanolobus mangrovi]|uniref:Sjogren's syndrome/scleroderma autoantigen 1 family protein n=1 Tax=Methanolobus mangrovi TaxID=3072977 RepID=A0AA51YG22_9EURY|nr:Sjogren's syndrome/scleroderma autoantigen 1 family protein [Methanolobus mangrovi]WMW21482.1 Sjogren's syndrome/scleroderma autoantigen 1 family protein [Methanolobus mangrovi]